MSQGVTGYAGRLEPARTTQDFMVRFIETLLPALILWNLFLFVLNDHVYTLVSPEVALSLSVLALIAVPFSLLSLARWHGYYAVGIAALLVLFVDYRFESALDLNKYALVFLFIAFFALAMKLRANLYTPLAAGLVVMLVTTCFLLLKQPSPGIAAFDLSGPVPDGAPPRLIHLVLDEHIGIEGFPNSIEFGTVMKEKVKAFYRDRDFLLFGGAYGHYADTYDAISNLVNFSREPTIKSFISGGEAPFILTRNRYFELLAQRRYRLHVVGTRFLDLCTNARALTSDCQSYHFSEWKSISKLDISLSEKMEFVLRSFVSEYPRYKRLQHLYETSCRPLMTGHGESLTTLADWVWIAPPAHPYSANAMQMIDEIWDNVVALPHGHAAFIHLMLPHFPYVYGPGCVTRPLQEWKEKMDDVQDGTRTKELQDSRYRLYFEQMDCVLMQLNKLFDRMKHAGIFDDSVIVIHGDHGSRLGIRDADARSLTPSDIIDYFSLLYTIKMPGKHGGYVPTRYPIEELLIDTLALPIAIRQSASNMPSPHFVFLRPHGEVMFEYHAVPYPDISSRHLHDPS